MLNFVLSRRREYQANRYWDTVTGFPKGLSPMPNLVLLDADDGRFYQHHFPYRGFQWGAVTMMRAPHGRKGLCFLLSRRGSSCTSPGGSSEALGFKVRSALSAMKKATADSLGTALVEDGLRCIL